MREKLQIWGTVAFFAGILIYTLAVMIIAPV